MKHAVIYLIFLLLGSMLLSDCMCKHVCTQQMPCISFSGFDSTALDTVKLVRYQKDGGKFDQVVDSQFYSSNTSSNVYVAGMDDANIFLDFTFDYMVILPKAGRSWRINDIDLVATSMSNTSHCSGSMSYKLNDTLHTIPSNSMESYLKGVVVLK